MVVWPDGFRRNGARVMAVGRAMLRAIGKAAALRSGCPVDELPAAEEAESVGRLVLLYEHLAYRFGGDQDAADRARQASVEDVTEVADRDLRHVALLDVTPTSDARAG